MAMAPFQHRSNRQYNHHHVLIRYILLFSSFNISTSIQIIHRHRHNPLNYPKRSSLQYVFLVSRWGVMSHKSVHKTSFMAMIGYGCRDNFMTMPSFHSKTKRPVTARLQLQSQNSNEEIDTTVDVVIVGAGWSGLAAARYIYDNQKGDSSSGNKYHNTVRILEARDDIGGRSKTISVGSNLGGDDHEDDDDDVVMIELGSERIEGIVNNPIFDIVKDLNIEYTVEEGRSRMVTLKNNPDSTTMRSRLKKGGLYWNGRGQFRSFLRQYNKKINRSSMTRSDDKSLGSVVNRFLRGRQRRLSGWERRSFDCYLHGTIVTDYAADLCDLSSKWWDFGNWTTGDDVYLAAGGGGGFTAAIRQFAAPIRSQIECNSIVKTVDYTDPRHIVVHYHHSNNNSQSLTENVIKARYVIITVPIGVLKAGTITFKPPLPPSKHQAINELGNGHLTKCILCWANDSEVFWPRDAEWITCIDKSPKKGSQRRTTGRRRRRRRWTEFYNPLQWNNNSSSTSPPILVSYAAGRDSRYVEEHLSDDEIAEEVLATLRAAFGSVHAPQRVIVTRWGVDEFSRGAYSFYQVGSSPSTRVEIGRCVGDGGRLHFAGEATDVGNPSTVHGAFASGVRVAREIMGS